MKAVLLAALFCFGSFGTGVAQAADDPSREIARLQDMRGTPGNGKAKIQTEGLRASVVHEAAYTLGVQSGAAWRQERRIAALDAHSTDLDKIFNFGLLLLDGDVLPPVIVEAGPGLRLENNHLGISIIKHFKILEDARFVTTPPSWRDYLAVPFDGAAVEHVNGAILPKNQSEREIWRDAVQDGFYEGIAQADRVFEARLNRLGRDFRGIIRFHILARQGLVAMPHISRGQYDIVVDGKELRIGERVFRVSGSAFQGVDAWHLGR